jgi:ADP-ribosylglycohydrolase
LADLRAVSSPEDRDELELIASYPKRTGSGYVVDTFWSAWDAFASASSYEGSVKAAVAYGSDTDTTACVAGGLAGIYWGVSGIPSTWLITMRGSAIVSQLIDRLLNSSVEAQ